MEALAPVIAWFGENEAALSGMAAMAMLIGLLLSPLGSRARKLLGRSEAPGEAKPVPGSMPASAEHRTEKISILLEDFLCTGDEQAHTLGAAVREATLSALSNLTGLSVKSDPAAADYIASGSIQAAGARYRATVRLAERESGESFWSERFEGDLADLFDAQDELAARLSNAIRFNALTRESSRVAGSGAQGFEELLSQAAPLLLRSDAEEWRQAEGLIDDAVRMRPGDSMVQAMKTCCHLREVMVGWRAVSPADAEAAALHAQRAVQQNDRSDFAHMILAAVHLYAERDLDAAKRECQRSLELNPYYILGTGMLGACESYAGDYSEGALRCEKSAAIDPKFEANHRALSWAAIGWFAEKDYERALENALRSDERFREVPRTLLVLTTAAMHAGKEDLARRTAERIRTKYPDLVLSDLDGWPFRDPEPWQRFVDGLRRAGLPDG